MICIEDKKLCCGCTACYSICPKKAITMQPDSEGFLYPKIDESLCINCNLCEKVCPVLKSETHKEETKGYIVRYKNEAIVSESTSGGAFTAFATYLLDNGAVVYGAGYDENMQVVTKMATTTSQLKEMRGSKFVQSNLKDTFAQIKKQLADGVLVVFSGTPCQVGGLVSCLGKKPENLVLIDFVCRGVPSPGLWKNYVDMMENKYKSKMISARFKHKTYGYHATTMKIDFENGKTWYGSGRIDPMMKAFVKEMASRPSCSACAFKGVERPSDITMFDCYKFSKVTGLPDDNKGYTSLFVHTKKGHELFERIKFQLMVYEADVEDLVNENGIMVKNSAKPNAQRDEFYKLAASCPIDMAMDKVNPITFKDKMIEKSKVLFFKTGLIKLIKVFKRGKIEVNSR